MRGMLTALILSMLIPTNVFAEKVTYPASNCMPVPGFEMVNGAWVLNDNSKERTLTCPVTISGGGPFNIAAGIIVVNRNERHQVWAKLCERIISLNAGKPAPRCASTNNGRPFGRLDQYSSVTVALDQTATQGRTYYLEVHVPPVWKGQKSAFFAYSIQADKLP